MSSAVLSRRVPMPCPLIPGTCGLIPGGPAHRSVPAAAARNAPLGPSGTGMRAVCVARLPSTAPLEPMNIPLIRLRLMTYRNDR